MKIDIPFGVKHLDIGAITVYTIRLRFSTATYSWIKPELDLCDSNTRECIRVNEHNGYATIRLETNSMSMQDNVYKAIQRGQLKQQRYALDCWEDYGFRPDASKLGNPKAIAEIEEDTIDRIDV